MRRTIQWYRKQMDPVAFTDHWQKKKKNDVRAYVVFLVCYKTQDPQNSSWDRMQGVSSRWQATLWDMEGREIEREKRGKGTCGWHRSRIKAGLWHLKNSLYFLRKMLLRVLKQNEITKKKKKSVKTKVSPLISNGIRGSRKALRSAWSLGEIRKPFRSKTKLSRGKAD